MRLNSWSGPHPILSLRWKQASLLRTGRSVLFCCFYYFDCTSRGCSKLKHLSRIYGFWNVIRLNYSDCKEKCTIKIWTKPREIPAWCKSLFIYPARKLKESNLCLHFYTAHSTFLIQSPPNPLTHTHYCAFTLAMPSYQGLNNLMIPLAPNCWGYKQIRNKEIQSLFVN